MGIDSVHLDLGHVDIFRGLLSDSGLEPEQQGELFELLQRKAVAELDQWVAENITDPQLSAQLTLLPRLSGGPDVLKRAKQGLSGAPQVVIKALDDLQQIVTALSDSNVTIYLDLGELPGFHYHTGVVFAAYVQGYGKALGNGGRYDDIGESFGRSRPATGFAFDLKSLVTQGQAPAENIGGIYVPATDDPEVQQQIDKLRAQGHRVVRGFAGQLVDYPEINCDRQLVHSGGKYRVKNIS